jgi:phosphonate transport system substrate-binding protein
MSLQFSISPDFNADQLSQWFIFNTWMQRALDRSIHFEPYDDFAALRGALAGGKVDILYANPFDTAFLVRERGYLPVARARRRSDEAIVAVAAGSPAQRVTDLAAPLRVAATDAPDVEMIGRILLEPAGLGRENVRLTRKANYVLVAKELLAGGVDAAFFLEHSFAELSDLVRSRMRILVASRIYVVQHALLVSPQAAEVREQLLAALLAMHLSERSSQLLADLGFLDGWEELTLEDAEFMIDLMDTLID